MTVIYQDGDYQVRTDDRQETVWVESAKGVSGRPASLNARCKPPDWEHFAAYPDVTYESHFAIGRQLIRAAARPAVEELALKARERACNDDLRTGLFILAALFLAWLAVVSFVPHTP